MNQERPPILTQSQHRKFDKLLRCALQANANQSASSGAIVARIMQVVAALDQGNIGEVDAWLNDYQRIAASDAETATQRKAYVAAKQAADAHRHVVDMEIDLLRLQQENPSDPCIGSRLNELIAEEEKCRTALLALTKAYHSMGGSEPIMTFSRPLDK